MTPAEQQQETTTRQTSGIAANNAPSATGILLHVGQEVELCDGNGRVLGSITIDETPGNIVLGTFKEAPAYQEVRNLFEEFNELVNQQLFSHLDELDARIAELACRLHSAGHVWLPEIRDVQIEGKYISFRLS